MRLIVVATAMISMLFGAIAGAAIDTSVAHWLNGTARPASQIDRLERLTRFPPPGPIAFVGDSHVERGPWRILLGPQVANYGVGGDSAADVRKRLDRIDADRFLILVGVNDILAEREPIEVAKDIASVVKEAGKPVYLLSVMPVRERYAKHNSAIRQLNALLPDHCSGDCELIDTWTAVADAGELNARYTRDGLHLNADGYDALGAFLRRRLTPDIALSADQ